MKAEVRKSFEKDLGKIRDGDLLAKIKANLKPWSDTEHVHYRDRPTDGKNG